ncbi:hypothetical protein FH972_005383 [Carpinus fangiana]|uniref:Uncharacterized protein n=1 Tax=Carpinus fangiana TaxID=176857 RepID=A0A5N6QSD5_9ROSI|nr:hypothetical protein FH972_005383 [Carpinus fangiana]
MQFLPAGIRAGCVWWLGCPNNVWNSVEVCGGRAGATPVVEWCDVTGLLRGSTADGLNGVRCCLSCGVVGAVSPVTACEVSRCAAVGNDRGAASFGFSTCAVFVGCRTGATPVVEWCDVTGLLRGSTADGLNGVPCCLSGGAVGTVSPMTGCEVSRCAAVGNDRGAASFGLSTCEVFVGCRTGAAPVVEWCDVTELLRGSTADGLNGVRCCLSGGAVGAVSPVTACEVSRCAAEGNDRGAASFRLSTCEWCEVTGLLRGSTDDGLNGVRCCLSGGAVGAVSPVTGCEVSRCAAVGNDRGAASFGSSTMTSGDGVRCKSRRLSGAVLLRGSAADGQNGVRCCLSGGAVGAIFL